MNEQPDDPTSADASADSPFSQRPPIWSMRTVAAASVLSVALAAGGGVALASLSDGGSGAGGPGPGGGGRGSLNLPQQGSQPGGTPNGSDPDPTQPGGPTPPGGDVLTPPGSAPPPATRDDGQTT